jgi:hypothetical protein
LKLPHEVTLFLLGCNILIRCKYKPCADAIAEYFSPAIRDPWCSPDVIVDCTWELPHRYLFRSRPPENNGPLPGIHVHTMKKMADIEWSFTDPPIPPFVLEPFRNRFIGLHGGAVISPVGNCLMILGDRGSGKTTITRELVNNHGFSLLTDETLFIHRRTSLVEPFPRPMKIMDVKNGYMNTKLLPAQKVCSNISNRPALATHALFLVSSNRINVEFVPIPPADAFKQLLQHHLSVGCEYDEAIFSLAYLAHNLSSSLFSYCSYDQLVRSYLLLLNFAVNLHNSLDTSLIMDFKILFV